MSDVEGLMTADPKLVKNANYLSNNAYPLFGLIKRRNNVTGLIEYISFNPEEVFLKNQDINLQSGDLVKFFTDKEIFEIVSSLNVLDEIKTTIQTENISSVNLESDITVDNPSNNNIDASIRQTIRIIKKEYNVLPSITRRNRQHVRGGHFKKNKRTYQKSCNRETWT